VKKDIRETIQNGCYLWRHEKVTFFAHICGRNFKAKIKRKLFIKWKLII